MIFRNHKAVLSVLVATALTGAVVTDAFAQSSRSSERGNRGGKQAKAEALYPNATRQEPTVKASAKLGSKLQKMIDSYNKEKFPETRTQADAIPLTAPRTSMTSRWPRSWRRRLPTRPTIPRLPLPT